MGQAPNWAAKVPFVNGHLYSHASIECDVDGLLFAGIISINYEDPVKPGKLYGTGGVLVGRTPGTNKPTLSMTMLRRDWDIFRPQLATGAGSAGNGSFGTKSFDVRVTYHEDALPTGGGVESPTTIGIPLGALAAGAAPASQLGPGTSEDQTTIDVIERVRITGVSLASSEGSAAVAVVLTCDPWLIRWGGHTGDGRDGLTNLSADAATVPAATAQSGQGDGKEGPEPEVGGPTRGASSGEFWYATEDGFEGTDYPANPWDGFIFADTPVPGLCKVNAVPGQTIDKQKPNGADAAALIIRGYAQAEIDVEVTLWMPSHWVLWQQFINKFWRHPNKASRFEKPTLKTKPPTDHLTNKPKLDSTGQPIIIQDPAVLREHAAIDRAVPATREEAAGIYHPSLASLRIGAAILTSVSTPTPGSEPQTFVVKMKLVEYVPAAEASQVKSVAKKVKGSTKSVTTAPPLTLAPGQNQSVPYSPAPANSPAITPAMTESSPTASFQPP